MTNSELKQIAIELVGEEELSRRFQVWITGLIKKERIKRSESTPEAFFLNEATVILEDLNKRTGSRFRLCDATKVMIKERMREGWLAEDFIKVHEVKCAKWLGKDSFADNLRPSTLYRKCHFHEYHAEWFAWDKQRTGSKPKSNPKTPEAGVSTSSKAEREAVIAKLMAKAWDAFDTWAEFMQWTIQFPDPQSLEKYTMPDRLRKMRTAPGMVMNVLKKQSPDWAEAEYNAIKKGFNHE